NLTEWRDEEDNWIAAMEWADKNGAQIISSSLGYTFKRYFYRDMDGETSMVARAANMAARKGMLVVTAAGNDGKSAWKYICTPGDADSALTIGGIDPETNYHIGFSSYGPAADETLKPNISAAGLAFVADSKSYTQAMGTSFATPLITGFAACAWQMNPDLSNMQLFKELEKSASLYPYFDYAHGYGVPQASYFILKETGVKSTAGKSFSINNENENITVKLDDRFFTDTAINAQLPDMKLFYHIANADNRVLKYYVIQPKEQNVLTLPKEDLPTGGTLRVHFLGYTEELKY
ncbi:MAG: S8 family serine peptidase, partial [Bacteroidia bacterium]